MDSPMSGQDHETSARARSEKKKRFRLDNYDLRREILRESYLARGGEPGHSEQRNMQMQQKPAENKRVRDHTILFDKFFVRPIRKAHGEVYFNDALLDKYRIQKTKMDFDDGAVDAFAQKFVEPLDPEAVTWILNATIPWKDTDMATMDWRAVHDGLKRSLMVERDQQWTLMDCDCHWLSRQPRFGNEWNIWAAYRPFNRRTGKIDETTAHVYCHIEDKAPLREDAFLTATIMTVIMAAMTNGTERKLLHHHIVPVTVIESSGRLVRVVQGIANFRKLTMELRYTDIVDFSEGFTAPQNWTKFCTLLGWLVGDPVGVTTRA